MQPSWDWKSEILNFQHKCQGAPAKTRTEIAMNLIGVGLANLHVGTDNLAEVTALCEDLISRKYQNTSIEIILMALIHVSSMINGIYILKVISKKPPDPLQADPRAPVRN